MPFDFKKYDEKCSSLNPEQLQKEWEHYTRLISGAATSTTVSGLALPLTAGVSVIGVGMAAPAIHNARKKREIIEKHLQRHGTTHNTRAKDVLSSMAISGTVGVVTLGVGAMGADVVAQHGAEHGISAIVNNETAIKVGIHAALDGAATAGEESHHNHKKEKEANKMIAKAKAKIAAAQAQGFSQGQPLNEKQYGYQTYPTQNVYGAVQIPGAYQNTGTSVATPQPQFQDIKYPLPPTVTEIKYDVPPTPIYTPAPPPYSLPPSAQSMSPVPQYNPQMYAPPPQPTPAPFSPAPTVSSLSSYSSQPSQMFSPVSTIAPTPAPQPQPVYSPPPSAPVEHSNSPAQSLPPFQAHVAALGAPVQQPQLVWSHVHNQWIAQEAPYAQLSTALVQPAAPTQGYPFPQQPTDRRASYASAPTPAPTQTEIAPQVPTPALHQPLPPQDCAPIAGGYAQQQFLQYHQAPTQPAQAPTMTAYGYPTPGQTPGVSQMPAQVPYFPPPPSAQGTPNTPSYTPAPPQHPTSALQYAPVATPGPHAVPHRQSIASLYSQTTTPLNQQPEPRHYSLPNPTPIPGQEKLQYSYQPHAQHYAIPEHTPAAQQVYHPQAHTASWVQQAPVTTSAASNATAPPLHQPEPVQGLCDAYGGMQIR